MPGQSSAAAALYSSYALRGGGCDHAINAPEDTRLSADPQYKTASRNSNISCAISYSSPFAVARAHSVSQCCAPERWYPPCAVINRSGSPALHVKYREDASLHSHRMGAVQSAAQAAVSSTVSMFEACMGNKSGRRRTLVNLQDMGVDIYEPAGVLSLFQLGFFSPAACIALA